MNSLDPVIAAFSEFGISKKNMLDWRVAVINCTEQPYGHINGLPGLYGKALVTDGIEVLCSTSTGYFFGHWQHFIPNDGTKEKKQTKNQTLKEKYK